ncbi:MAG: hypothetical protein AVO33_02110 [delta proteobacterium ML8_F1]|nr:MAG: hypothetical protein AVO33_02110 [delta proteobacterium ML8_F1]
MRMLIVLLLELFLGDPRRFIHPVEVMGGLIVWIENRLYEAFQWIPMRVKGLILLSSVGGLSYWLPRLALEVSFSEDLLWTYFTWTGLGIHSLYRHGSEVSEALMKGPEEARQKLALFVSRDTLTLDDKGIQRGTVESLAENTNDGIIAPVFYLLVGGIPLMMLYKAVNTLDAMVGYKNERYTQYGFFSAKMDDVMNLIPARITGLLLVASALLLGFDWRRALKTMLRDASLHESPNAGYPESAVAGALGIALGGPGAYHGRLKEKPWLGDSLREIEIGDIKRTQSMMLVTAVLGLIPLILVEVF